MTTQYDTKEQALEMGACYAGYADPEDRKRVLARAEISDKVLGWPHSFPATETSPAVEKRLEVYEFENPNGIKVGIGISRFREGYDLWLISPEGRAIRT